MEIRFKKLHPNAITPTKATEGSAGFDLYVHTKRTSDNDTETYGTGIAMEVPKGYVGVLVPRSSLYKKGNGSARLTNRIGILDSDYRGEIKFVYSHRNDKWLFDFNERCGQLVIVPCPEIKLIESDELSTTERGTGGFGSTGV